MTWRAVLVTAFLLVCAGRMEAHGGFENDTEVRVYPDRVKIVVRVSQAFAWRVMGAEAPTGLDDAAQVAAAPAMARTAAALVEVRVGGQVLTPTRTAGLFEPQRDVAFVLTYPPLPRGELSIAVLWFPLLGTVESGTIAVFDHTSPAARFTRDLPAVVKRTLDGGNAVLKMPGGLPAAGPGLELGPQIPVASAADPGGGIVKAWHSSPSGLIAPAAILIVAGSAWRRRVKGA